jgi:uncharacterized protein DUF4436
LEPLSIDTLNDAMLIRAYLMPVSSASTDTYAGPGKDLTAFIIHDKTVEEVKLTAAEHVATSTFEVDLNEGSVSHYPLDSYAAELAVDLMDAKSSLKVPVQVTVWEGVLGYRLHTTAEAAADPHTAGITIAIRRSGAFALFALCAYDARVVLGFSALAIGVLVFAEVRQVDATLIGALAAVAFALPALRSALPGSPPLGVQADVWVFLWAELAVVWRLGLWSSSGQELVPIARRRPDMAALRPTRRSTLKPDSVARLMSSAFAPLAARHDRPLRHREGGAHERHNPPHGSDRARWGCLGRHSTAASR